MKILRNSQKVVAGSLIQHTTDGTCYEGESVKIAGSINHYIIDDIGKRILISNTIKRKFFSKITEKFKQNHCAQTNHGA